MFSKVRRSLCIVMSGFLVLTPMMTAQQTESSAAPIPPQVLHAHTVFVSNGGSSNYFEDFGGGANRAYNTFYKELKQTQHYELVSSPAQADIIFEIRAIAPEVSGTHDIVSYNPQVVLTVRDPGTNAVLWTESANIRAIGTKARRDRQFDESIAVLVDKLAVVTGQPLTEAQTKAIAANSSTKMSTGAKVFIAAVIAGSAAIAAVGIHMATSQHQPTLPPMPTTPTPPFP